MKNEKLYRESNRKQRKRAEQRIRMEGEVEEIWEIIGEEKSSKRVGGEAEADGVVEGKGLGTGRRSE